MSLTAGIIRVALCLHLIWVAVGRLSAADWIENFDGRDTTWHKESANSKLRILGHQRLAVDAHAGGCEWLRVECEPGGQDFIAHDVGRPPIIEELSIAVWVKADRPGVSLAARLVMPRSVDPRSGQAMTTVALGTNYTDIGRWQLLRLENLPRLLTRQVHALRMQYGSQLDEREAYVDAVLLKFQGGQGPTNVWIDDLSVAGHVGQNNNLTQNQNQSQNQNPDAAATPAAWAAKGIVRLPSTAATGQNPEARPAANLVNSILTCQRRPLFPRIIQHRGESLETLKRLGFNAVWLQRLPTPEILEEARRLGIWLICPPPNAPAVESSSALGGTAPGDPAAAREPRLSPPLPDMTPAMDCILAWDMGMDLAEADLEATRRWAEQVRSADRRRNRPLVCGPREELRGFSRVTDLLLMDRRPLCSSLALNEYAAWLRRQPLLASPGTPIWTTVQTQPGEALRRQLNALEPNAAVPGTLSPDLISLSAYTSISAGSRGLLFLSDSPLDAPDPQTQQRAAALELLNLELELIEPWAAAGSFLIEAQSATKEVAAAVLSADHAKLLLPLWIAQGSQCVPPHSSAAGLNLVVPGVPESTRAYLLTPSGVENIRRNRVAGGVCVMIDEFELVSRVLLAHDSSIVGAVHRRAAQSGRRVAELQRLLAAGRLNSVRSLAEQLAARSTPQSVGGWLDEAGRAMQACDAHFAAGDLNASAVEARRAMRFLRQVERAYWQAAVDRLASPTTSPAALCFDTLPAHWRFMDRLTTGKIGPNLAPGGDFEDLGVLTTTGWRHIAHASAMLQTTVELSPQAAHSGRMGLRMAISPAEKKNPPVAIEGLPIIFTTPSVDVEAGQIVCIHGWVRVPRPIAASSDGLLVVDSCSGEALAERIATTKDWRQFAIYRAATQSGPMCVSFALNGLGEAWLDDVAIQVISN
jgi:hypothetical protein